MKIAIDCRMIGSGGIGSYLTALLPFFLEKHECILFGTLNQLERYSNSCKIIECNIPPFSLKELFSFKKSILKVINSCDIYYTPYCNIPGGIKIPIYSTIHDVVFLDVKGLSGKIGTIARKFFYQYAINKSKSIFTVSNFSKERIEHHLNTHKKSVIVTYNAVPHWFTDGVPSAPKTDTILFVGNIKKHKGLHTLLSAYNICREKGFTGKLVIVGNSENFRTTDLSITSKIEELKDSVIFTGRISDAELKNYYTQAKLLIQPSLYEGFGMPPMEALSLGTNAIISDIPVFKEIYKNLPIIFFELENENDLANKILLNYNNSSPSIEANPYSFERTFTIINNEFIS